MKKQITIVVIATRSILLADGLGALLKAIPQIEKVEIVRAMEIQSVTSSRDSSRLDN